MNKVVAFYDLYHSVHLFSFFHGAMIRNSRQQLIISKAEVDIFYFAQQSQGPPGPPGPAGVPGVNGIDVSPFSSNFVRTYIFLKISAVSGGKRSRRRGWLSCECEYQKNRK